MSDPVILALVAILLLFTAVVTARRAAVPWRGARQSIRPPTVSPVPAKTGWPVAVGAGIPGLSSPPRAAQRPASSPRVIRGSDYLQNSHWSHLESFRVGREGEDLIAKQIAEHLDGRWTMFRNLDLPDKKGDIDIVLVGPAGIHAIEVKSYAGDLWVENGRYHIETKAGHLFRMRRGPGAQARSNAARLCNYLKGHSITHKNSVTAVVALSKGVPKKLISTATAIWTQDDIDRRLTDLRSQIYLSSDQIERIVRVFEAVPSNATNTLH